MNGEWLKVKRQDDSTGLFYWEPVRTDTHTPTSPCYCPKVQSSASLSDFVPPAPIFVFQAVLRVADGGTTLTVAAMPSGAPFATLPLRNLQHVRSHFPTQARFDLVNLGACVVACGKTSGVDSGVSCFARTDLPTPGAVSKWGHNCGMYGT